MGNTLCIDVSVEPAHAVVTSFHAGSIEILESHSFETGGLFSRETLSSNGSSITDEDHQSQTTEGNVAPEIDSRISSFQNILGKITSAWETSLLILPTFDYVSLNLELPFDDDKNIYKILPFEVQDVVPFEIEEFFLNHSIMGVAGDNLFNVHVSALPKRYIAKTIDICHKAGFEPEKISSPASIIAGLKTLAPNYFAENSLLFYSCDNLHYFSLLIDGAVVDDRVIELKVYDRVSGINQDVKQSLLSEIRLTVASAERKYKLNLERIYIFSDLFVPSELQQAIGRDSEILKLSEFVKSKNEESGLASLGAVFDRSEEIDTLLTNFRTNEFAYNPVIKEVIKTVKKLSPYSLMTILVALVCGIIVYSVRALEINSLNNSIAEKVSEAVPTLSIDESTALLDLNRAIGDMQQELSNLGSPSNNSPLDGLLAVTTTLPSSGDYTINEIEIVDTKIEIKGLAQKYQAIDKIEQAFKRNRSVFCRTERPDTSSRGSGEINFNLTLKMCK
ncbi:MAG: hypothetical protein R3A13_10635 [Bdellovibrionota bacterium]